MTTSAVLALEDGSVFKGISVGAAGQTVGEVIESKAPGLKAGDHVLTSIGWQTHGVARGVEVTQVDGSKVLSLIHI